MDRIPGILVLEKNKRYGIADSSKSNKNSKTTSILKSKSKSNVKFWYKVKPYDKSRQTNLETTTTENISSQCEFFVPYKLNGKFSKSLVNKYILFSCSSFSNDINENTHDVSNKKYYGSIENMIGDVNVPEHIYEYLLYCKLDYRPNIYKTIKRDTSEQLSQYKHLPSHVESSVMHSHYKIRLNPNIGTVFTIDPERCTDFDDACSILSHEDGSKMIGIHITNVPVYFDMYHLWNVFTNSSKTEVPPISSIYLPNKTIHMLPTTLSERLCSLKAKEQRIVFSLFLHLDPDNTIMKTEFSTNSVYISRNFVYESPELLKFKAYQQLKTTCMDMKNNPKNTEMYNMQMRPIHDSHEVIACLMITMNMYAGKFCYDNQIGVFRSSVDIQNQLVDHDKEIVHRHLHMPMKDSLCEYIGFSKETRKISDTDIDTDTDSEKYRYQHVPLNIQFYSHVTSPIRRMIDIINLSEIMTKINGNSYFLQDMNTFIKSWKREKTIQEINVTNKSIRKVHNETKLIQLFYYDPTIQNRVFKGICIQIESIPGDVYVVKYTIYFEELKLLKTIRLPKDEISLYSTIRYQFYLFKDKDNIQHKWCIQKNIKNS